MACCPLVEEHGDIGRGDLAAEGNKSGETHHDGLHLVLIHQNYLLGKLRVIADAAIAPEELVQQQCHSPSAHRN